MSTNPEPMTEKRLGDLMAIARLWPEGLKVRVDDAHMQGVQAVRALADAVPDLVDEIRRLRKCQQEDWCPGVPVACQKHVDQQAFAIKAAQDLLLERARQADELLAKCDEARAEADRWRTIIDAIWKVCGLPQSAGLKPDDALALQQARTAVVEAAKGVHPPRKPNGTLDEEALWDAVDALEKLEEGR